MKEHSAASNKTQQEVWLAHEEGPNAEEHYYIEGSRAGLEQLREHITTAIDTGESPMHDEARLDFAGIRRVDGPRDSIVDSTLGWKENLIGAGCLGLIVAVLVLAVIGLISVLGW